MQLTLTHENGVHGAQRNGDDSRLLTWSYSMARMWGDAGRSLRCQTSLRQTRNYQGAQMREPQPMSPSTLCDELTTTLYAPCCRKKVQVAKPTVPSPPLLVQIAPVLNRMARRWAGEGDSAENPPSPNPFSRMRSARACHPIIWRPFGPPPQSQQRHCLPLRERPYLTHAA